MSSKRNGSAFHTPANSRAPKRSKTIEFSRISKKKFVRQDEGSEVKRFDDVLCALNDDLLGKIFLGGYVNSIEVAKTTSCISKTFMRIAKSQVNMLDLRKCPNLKCDNMASIAQRFTNLTEIDLGYCDNLHDISGLQNLPKLRVLRLHGTSVDDEGMVQFLNNGDRRELHELDLSATTRNGSTLIGDKTIQLIALHCPNITVLKLGWCRRVTNVGMTFLASLQKLVELDVSLTNVTDDGCETLSTFPALKKLDLSATHLGAHFLTALFPSPSKVTHLNLRFHDHIDNIKLMVIVDNAPNLKYLNIENCGLSRCRLKEFIASLRQRGAEVDVERKLEEDTF